MRSQGPPDCASVFFLELVFFPQHPFSRSTGFFDPPSVPFFLLPLRRRRRPAFRTPPHFSKNLFSAPPPLVSSSSPPFASDWGILRWCLFARAQGRSLTLPFRLSSHRFRFIRVSGVCGPQMSLRAWRFLRFSLRCSVLLFSRSRRVKLTTLSSPLLVSPSASTALRLHYAAPSFHFRLFPFPFLCVQGSGILASTSSRLATSCFPPFFPPYMRFEGLSGSGPFTTFGLTSCPPSFDVDGRNLSSDLLRVHLTFFLTFLALSACGYNTTPRRYRWGGPSRLDFRLFFWALPLFPLFFWLFSGKPLFATATLANDPSRPAHLRGAPFYLPPFFPFFSQTKFEVSRPSLRDYARGQQRARQTGAPFLPPPSSLPGAL